MTAATGQSGPARFVGLLAEFRTEAELVSAASAVRGAGFRRFDAFTPYPVEELSQIVESHHSRLPWLVFGGGVVGAICGFTLQYWTAVKAYPMNIGGRPYDSWPSFIVVTFETTILFAAFAAVLGMLALNGLPRPHHPLFNVPRFALASRDSYFLFVDACDPRFDRAGTREQLLGLAAMEVSDVED